MIKDKIEIYNLDSEMETIDYVDNFYKKVKQDFKEKGETLYKVKTVFLLLINSAGKIYVQKRSKNKIQEIGKYDKTIGGHVIVGDDFDRSLIIECGQNLGISAVVEPPENFLDRSRSLDLKRIAICSQVDYLPEFMSKKILDNGEMFSQLYMSSIYVGYYDGEVDFINGKNSVIEMYSLEELEEIIENNPYEVTHDLKFMVSNYSKFIVPLKI